MWDRAICAWQAGLDPSSLCLGIWTGDLYHDLGLESDWHLCFVVCIYWVTARDHTGQVLLGPCSCW